MITTTNQLELDYNDVVDESFLDVKISHADVAAKEYVFHLYPNSYGKTLFLVYNGVLRQFRVIRTYLCPWNYHLKNNHKTVNAIHELEICGIGRILVAHRSGCGIDFVCKVYSSPEDYRNGKEAYLGYKADNLVETQPFGFSLCYRQTLCSEYYYAPKIWRWNGTRAVEEDVKEVYMFYWFDSNGIGTRDTGDLPKGYYHTKAECEKDNAIKVEYFAEEVVKPTPTQTELFFGTEKYKLNEDELKKVKELISSFNKS